MACGCRDPGWGTTEWLQAREIVVAAVQRAAHAVVAPLDKVVEAEADTAVMANPNSGNGVVRLGTLEAVHFAPPFGPLDR
jgi:hypothetical protein